MNDLAYFSLDCTEGKLSFGHNRISFGLEKKLIWTQILKLFWQLKHVVICAYKIGTQYSKYTVLNA